jgi:hypothetical protein
MIENGDQRPGIAPTCPAPSRFWKLALEQAAWSEPEVEHLLGCRRCRQELVQVFRAAGRRARAAAGLAAGMAALAACASRRARQPFALPQHRVEMGGPTGADQVAFTFDDPGLKASRCRHADGTYWLHLEHLASPPGTLMQVVLTGGAVERPWARYVVLRQGFESSVAQLWLDESVPAGADRLFLDRAEPPGEELATLLRASFRLARRNDPVAVERGGDGTPSAWQAWARNALLEGGAGDEVRQVLAEVLADESSGAPGPNRPAFGPAPR